MNTCMHKNKFLTVYLGKSSSSAFGAAATVTSSPGSELGQGQGSGSAQCTICSKPANPGHKLCSTCYSYYKAQKNKS